MAKKNELRNFALIWSGIFIVIALAPLLRSASPKGWAIAISILFLLAGIVKPLVLNGFYQYWLKIGEFIGGIVSKVMLSILFYLVFTPVAALLRLMGKDMLNKKIDRSASSYWIERKEQPESMKHQF